MERTVKAYNELVWRLLTAEDRYKFEWAIGAVLTGGPANDVVFYGHGMTGKTTLMTIVRKILIRSAGFVAPRVVFHESFVGRHIPVHDSDVFSFVEINSPLDTGNALVIEPTGIRIPVNKYYVLMTQIESELDAIAEICINRYRSLGEDHYRTEENI